MKFNSIKFKIIIIVALIFIVSVTTITIYSIYQTAEKLGVSAKEYIIDRISGEYKMQSLADMIQNYSTNKF